MSEDVLTEMAARLFRVAVAEVSPAQRATAKSCVYAILYGAGPKKVAEDVSEHREHTGEHTEAEEAVFSCHSLSSSPFSHWYVLPTLSAP
jgi:DNA polymerase I-like protein with 3'-5' exonuclease and polymerase domains